jgi:hypothetical protein
MTIAYIVPSLKNKLFMLSKECSGSSETILKFIVLTFNKSSLFETFTDCYAYVLLSGVTRVELDWAEPNHRSLKTIKATNAQDIIHRYDNFVFFMMH